MAEGDGPGQSGGFSVGGGRLPHDGWPLPEHGPASSGSEQAALRRRSVALKQTPIAFRRRQALASGSLGRERTSIAREPTETEALPEGPLTAPAPGSAEPGTDRPPTCRPLRPWTSGRELPDRGLPDRWLPDRRLPDRWLPDRWLPDRRLPDRGLPDRGLPDRGLPDRGPPGRGASARGPWSHGRALSQSLALSRPRPATPSHSITCPIPHRPPDPPPIAHGPAPAPRNCPDAGVQAAARNRPPVPPLLSEIHLPESSSPRLAHGRT